uniref:Uncharacterized protein n=1 Tax=Panagrolaimus davidi TaxID=227884 RepID=A0A914Q421_9BILA
MQRYRGLGPSQRPLPGPNILFVFAENDFQDFTLIFNNEVRCKNVYNLIYRNRVKDVITNDQIYKRILSPMFNEIVKSRSTNVKIYKLLLKWMHKLDVEDKETYIKMLKDDEIYQLIYQGRESVKKLGNNMDDETEARMQRKLKFKNYDITLSSKKANVNDKRVKRAQKEMEKLSLINFTKSDFDFKMVHINGEKKFLKRLLIFTSSEKRFCYEYCQNFDLSNIFHCVGCRKKNRNIRAKIDKNVDILLQEKEHICEKLEYSEENYFELPAIKKPNYEILENCSTKSGRALIIFNPNDKSQCHQFRWQYNFFYCHRCNATAKIINESDENEYIELQRMNHECEFLPYNREKFYDFKNFVLSPDFELRTEFHHGTERKILIIFDKKDRTKCYVYNHRSSVQLYQCKNCQYKGVHVCAKLRQNSDGENYIILSKKEHICESVDYTPQTNDYVILRAPSFKILGETSNGIPKIFIFDSKNKELCYVFSLHKHRVNQYECCGCLTFKSKNPDKSNRIVGIYLCKDKNGENYIQMKNNQKHCCKPKKYEPEKYQITETENVENYFYYRKKAYPKSVNVAIFDSTDSTLCYPFLKNSNHFYCLNCSGLKEYCSIPFPKINENGKEYFVHDRKKHVCKPIKISSIKTSKFQRIERKDVNFKESESKVKIDESRILKIPNFELRPNRNGIPEKKLVVFYQKDKSFCYEYYFASREKVYICSNRTKCGCYTKAKLHFDLESNEKFIELSEGDHICEPIKDEFANKIINASDFMVVEGKGARKPTKVILFTSAKEFYYDLSYNPSVKCFQCYSCHKKGKYISVKLFKNENGEDFLMASNNEHVCIPQKFDQEKFEKPKTVPESMFELHKNVNGEENKKLIVFTSDKKDFIYEYYLDRNNYYRCSICKKKKLSVTAKLHGENEKYLELSKTEHVCEPKKYDRKNYEKLKTVQESMFELYQNSIEKKDFVFEYYWVKCSRYQCLSCRKLKKVVTAKLCGENEKYLELSNVEHVCKPKKYDRKNYKK